MAIDKVIQEIISHPGFPEGECWHRESASENDQIIAQGDESKSLYCLEKGAVRVVGRIDIDDQRQLNPGVCDIDKGEIFGELVLFDDGPRSASIVAVADCELIVIDGKKLMAFLEKETDLGFRFMKMLMGRMVARMRKTNSKIFSLFAWGLKAHNVEQHL